MTLRRHTTWMLATVGVAVSLALLHYTYWLHLVRDANTMLQQGQQEAPASARYQQAVDWAPPLVSHIPGLREPLRHALLKQAQILYLEQQTDQALSFVQALPSQYGFLEKDWEYHLWYGNALFQRAIFQEDPQALVTDLQGAVREYQTALELNPASWDARFNYELVKQALLAEGEAGARQLRLLLEEKPREHRRKDELPPEKVG